MYVVLAIGLNDFLLKDIQFNFILFPIQFANGHLKASVDEINSIQSLRANACITQLKNNLLRQ